MSELINNRAQRIQTLKEIIWRLHQGHPPEEVKHQLRELVRQTDYSEIVAMEQELMAEGMSPQEIQSMCDLHSQVTREILVPPPPRPVPPGHPVDTFRREIWALRSVLLQMRQLYQRFDHLDDGEDASALVLEWRGLLNQLMDIEKHFQRKEHLFFSRLEQHGITGPSKVMWGKDDEIRALLRDLAQALQQPGLTAGEWKALVHTVGETVVKAVEEMMYKEEQILLPLCMSTLTEEDWAEIWQSSPLYGWCLVEPQEGYRPPEAVLREGLQLAGPDAIRLSTGVLTLEQLAAIFSTLPFDLTFVDADDRVVFFSEGRQRIFARSRAVLGRKVQHCHPPKSVEVVDRILQDFRSGRHDVAEFWINFRGRFVHIRYFAVHDRDGRYLGTLEVTQDVTQIRQLEGERRLLQYDDAPTEVQ